MTLCIQFVDKIQNIKEELAELCTLATITGQHIANAIKEVLSKLCINISNYRGQVYDGTSNMSSITVGVQAIIKEDAPMAVYMHCSEHCLNLVISHSYSLPILRNSLDKMKSTVMFFTSSPKRECLLTEIVTKGVIQVGKRKPLIDICQVQWATRHDAYNRFYNCFVFIVQGLEVICFHEHSEEYNTDVSTGWEVKSRVEAIGLFPVLQD